ncbi:MAG: DALR anticodon-binding domain-containing protein, partial [Gemmatimonadota bacterium]
GDDKDRVLIKSDGSYTYFLPDITYHRNKAGRGFQRAINIWGADHHGYVPRMRAAMQALGLGADFLEAVICQLVTLQRGGQEVKFSKRAGDYVTLRELFEETGVDVARYFFLNRRAEAQMIFDLDLALERSEKNPVYKIQYAHARMCSLFRRAGLASQALDLEADLDPLGEPAELEVVKRLVEFPELVEQAARAREPHRLTTYLEDLAAEVNRWYHEGNRDPSLRVLGVDAPVQTARLVLARAVQVVLRNGLDVLAIEAPERMEREEEPA